MATLYLLENEGFHSGKDEGNITKAAQRHGSNPARLRLTTTHWGQNSGTPFTFNTNS